jgi:hypothetical protein
MWSPAWWSSTYVECIGLPVRSATFESLEDRDAIGATPTEIINFPALRLFEECVDKANRINGANVVPYLFSIVIIDAIQAFFVVASG